MTKKSEAGCLHGYRKRKSSSCNAFILDNILTDAIFDQIRPVTVSSWPQRACTIRQVGKAYYNYLFDSVYRFILWKKIETLKYNKLL